MVRTENSSTRRVIQAGHMCQRKLSVEARLMEAQMYACSSGSRDSPGPRDCSEPIRTNHCQEVQHRESVSSSTSSDDLFPRSMRTSVQQPKHGILKTKIRERLNPQRNRHLQMTVIHR